MPKRPSEDRFLHEKLKEIESAQELGKLISHRLSMDDSSRAALASNGWAAPDVVQWTDGSFTFDQLRAVQLAEALDLDQCVFAGKALEVSLRRDTTGTGGRS